MHLKLENKQATGSFKARGAAHKLFALTDEELQRGVVAASTGNHALAMLHAAQAAAKQRGIQVPVRIFLPRTVSAAKADKLRPLGAQLELVGEDCVEAEAAARQAAQEQGSTYISPDNDAVVAGGQGSIAIELLMQLGRGRLDTGGGCGCRLGAAWAHMESQLNACLHASAALPLSTHTHLTLPALPFPVPPLQCLCPWAAVASSAALQRCSRPPTPQSTWWAASPPPATSCGSQWRRGGWWRQSGGRL